LRVFISIQLFIKVLWGASVLVAYINLLIRGAKVKGQNYFMKNVSAFELSFESLKRSILTPKCHTLITWQSFNFLTSAYLGRVNDPGEANSVLCVL
jgi:hypothetical protein